MKYEIIYVNNKLDSNYRKIIVVFWLFTGNYIAITGNKRISYAYVIITHLCYKLLLFALIFLAHININNYN